MILLLQTEIGAFAFVNCYVLFNLRFWIFAYISFNCVYSLFASEKTALVTVWLKQLKRKRRWNTLESRLLGCFLHITAPTLMMASCLMSWFLLQHCSVVKHQHVTKSMSLFWRWRKDNTELNAFVLFVALFTRCVSSDCCQLGIKVK